MPYYVYYIKTQMLNEVSPALFKKIKGKFVMIKDNKIKILGPDGNKKIASSTLNSFFAESLTEVYKGFNDFIAGVTLVKNALQTLGRVKNQVEKIDLRIILDICSFLLSSFTTAKNFCIENILQFCINFYNVIIKVKDFVSESLEAIVVSACSLFLPTKLFEIIKKISFFSNPRILDDNSVLFTIFSYIFDFIYACLDFLPDSFKGTKEKVQSFLCLIPFGAHHSILHKMKGMVKNYTDNRKILLEDSYQINLTQLSLTAKNNIMFMDWVKKSNFVTSVYNSFNNIIKSYEAYNKASRIEPNCFIFEGPPKCLKSFTMNLVISGLQTTSYSHAIKSATDGKDWYDSYNNEEIFYMDDVGQQGVSQWRTIINMVSPVKLPLECAEANLKDTKFFTSSKILLTTNNFINLQGLTKQDCISNIEALWRRGLVFDFSRVKLVNGSLIGALYFKHYDLTLKSFVNDFPSDFKEFLEIKSFLLQPQFLIMSSTPREDYVSWIIQIITVFDRIRVIQNKSNELTPAELSSIKNSMSLVPESLFDYFTDFSLWASEVFNYCKEYFLDIFNTIQLDYDTLTSKKILIPLMCALISGVSIALFSSFKNNNKKRNLQVESVILPSESNKSTEVLYLEKLVYTCNVKYDDEIHSCKGLVSGHFVIFPRHVINKEVFHLTIINNTNEQNILFENLKMNLIWKSDVDDVCVCRFDKSIPTPFKSVHHLFKNDNNKEGENWLILPKNSVTINKIFHPQRMDNISYGIKIGNFKELTNKIYITDYHYSIHGPGMCGSVVYDNNNGITGMHVAGSNTLNMGIAKRWSVNTRVEIKKIIENDLFILNLPISENSKNDFNGIKIDFDPSIYSTNKSNIKPTPLFGAFPITRVPSNLRLNGPHTVKDVSAKSFKRTGFVKEAPLAFASKVIDSIISPYKELSEEEIIGGSDLLAALNKDSSNGYKNQKEKEYYIDFNNKKFTPVFKKELDDLEMKILNGIIDVDKLLWVETLKDEIRGVEKETKPRSFRICTIHMQVLTKKYFGEMVQNLIATRNKHQIMVGVNPFVEWKTMHKKLSECKIVWDADIKDWDGSMLAQAQQMLNDCLLTKYTGENKEVAKFILYNLAYCLVGVNDDTYMTNHSMPSGSFLTAIYNSLINKTYTAFWFFDCFPSPTVDLFWDIVVDYVFGDDKANGVMAFENLLNAKTMSDSFAKIGLTLTGSDKGPITNPNVPLEDLSFLKRKFTFSFNLGEITCPLDKRTLLSGISWYDSSKDLNVVLPDKINSFQREMFLHNDGQDYVNELERICNERGIEFKKLSVSYLKYIYNSDKNEFLKSAWGGSKYL